MSMRIDDNVVAVTVRFLALVPLVQCSSCKVPAKDATEYTEISAMKSQSGGDTGDAKAIVKIHAHECS